jgi:DNA polymerase
MKLLIEKKPMRVARVFDIHNCGPDNRFVANGKLVHNSGGDKINLQNLPRGGTLRKSITAPKGYVIVACDSSQIEARTVGWLAGQEDLTLAFKEGQDIYSLFASDVYGRPVDKNSDLQARHVGKTAILGLGYGMSAPKFQLTLKNGKPPMDLEDAECQRVVELYRRKYFMIPRLWRECQALLIAMYEGREHSIKDGLVTSTTDGRLRLPNGLYLNYPGLKSEDGRNFSYKQRHETIKVYGAKITENIVQALARIIVFDQMRAISKRYKVVLTVHDEVCIVAPEQEAEEAKAFMVHEMSVPPSWCTDLPVSCKAAYGKTYGDCK